MTSRLHERNFISALAASGRTHDQISDELVSMGWHPGSARRSVEQFAAKVPTLEPTSVPGPDLENLPSSVDLGDRHASVLMFSRLPSTCLFGNFLSGEECEQIIALTEARLERSQVVGEDDFDGVQAYGRTSDQASFPLGSCELADRIHRRVARAARWPENQINTMEVVRYRPGAEFTPHYDFFCPRMYSDIIRRSGQRVATVLVYLNTPPCGGTTTFPDAEIEFVPQQGNALLFSYPRAAPDSLTLHAGVPVGSGEKWIGTFFLVDKEADLAPTGAPADREAVS